jgi:hypothetical protein
MPSINAEAPRALSVTMRRYASASATALLTTPISSETERLMISEDPTATTPTPCLPPSAHQ